MKAEISFLFVTHPEYPVIHRSLNHYYALTPHNISVAQIVALDKSCPTTGTGSWSILLDLSYIEAVHVRSVPYFFTLSTPNSQLPQPSGSRPAGLRPQAPGSRPQAHSCHKPPGSRSTGGAAVRIQATISRANPKPMSIPSPSQSKRRFIDGPARWPDGSGRTHSAPSWYQAGRRAIPPTGPGR